MNRKTNRLALIAGSVVLLAAGAAGAHHSRVAFDEAKTVEITGVVQRVAWRNPHIAINVEVDEAGGESVLWKIEGLPPSELNTHGLSRGSHGGDISVMGEI